MLLSCTYAVNGNTMRKMSAFCDVLVVSVCYYVLHMEKGVLVLVLFKCSKYYKGKT